MEFELLDDIVLASTLAIVKTKVNTQVRNKEISFFNIDQNEKGQGSKFKGFMIVNSIVLQPRCFWYFINNR